LSQVYVSGFRGLKMLKEFVYPWTQPWSFSQKCSCFIHIRPFCLICAKTQTLVSLSIMVANFALPCVFSNKVDPNVHYTTVSVRARGFTGCQVPGVCLLSNIYVLTEKCTLAFTLGCCLLRQVSV